MFIKLLKSMNIDNVYIAGFEGSYQIATIIMRINIYIIISNIDFEK